MPKRLDPISIDGAEAAAAASAGDGALPTTYKDQVRSVPARPAVGQGEPQTTGDGHQLQAVLHRSVEGEPVQASTPANDGPVSVQAAALEPLDPAAIDSQTVRKHLIWTAAFLLASVVAVVIIVVALMLIGNFGYSTVKPSPTAAPATAPPGDVDPPNIVLFYADDWTFRNLGAVNDLVRTPHLDEMAAKGVLFRHNCVIMSVCWVSRATLMTGQYASVHRHLFFGSTSMFDHWDETLYPMLKSAGYDVGFIGKW